jgi:hypothetical protein
MAPSTAARPPVRSRQGQDPDPTAGAQSFDEEDPLPDTVLRFFGHALRRAPGALAERMLDAGAEYKLRTCRTGNELRRQAVRAKCASSTAPLRLGWGLPARAG